MTQFSELGLRTELLKAISEMGFETPTPIQAQTIPLLLEGPTDIVALAQTGTGKTAAYGLPILHSLQVRKKKVQALVLSPTRELCLQITRELNSFAKQMPGSSIVAIYGGGNYRDQQRNLQGGANVIVATPGRLIDFLGRGDISLENVETVVLDEADEMLHLGFQEELETILAETPEEKNTWLFSATMPKEVRKIAQNYMHEPVEVSVGKTSEGAENIRHVYYVVHNKDRYEALKRILDFSPEFFGMVFCRTRLETQEIAEKLMKDGVNADALHGDLSQAQRDKVMQRFRNRSLKALVATDVAARGIDVSNVTHVVHYNLPDELENYTHRSGRTARAGKSGVSLSFVNGKEIGKIRQLEKALNRKFLREMVPTGQEVCEMKLFGLLQKVKDVQVHQEVIEEFMPRLLEFFGDMSREEIIQRFASLEFNQFLHLYDNATDLNAKTAQDHDGGDRYLTGQRMFINLGKMDGFDRSELLKFLCDKAKIDRNIIGRIDVKGVYSFFEIDKSLAEHMLQTFKGMKYRGRSLRIDLAGPEDNQGAGSGGGAGKGKAKWDKGKKKSWKGKK